MTVVLDSWAVLRYLEGTEPAAGLVAELLENDRPLMSWINLGEVHCILRRTQGDHPMAYADVFGAALAIAERATLWTGDPELLLNNSTWTWRDIRRR